MLNLFGFRKRVRASTIPPSPTRHPVRTAARSVAVQTRDLSPIEHHIGIPALQRNIASCPMNHGASGMTGASGVGWVLRTHPMARWR